MNTHYSTDLTLKERRLSHCSYEEVIGQGANKLIPRAWVIPDDETVSKIAFHKAPDGLVFYEIKSAFPLPEELTNCRYSSERKAAEIVNGWLATRAAEAHRSGVPEEAQPTTRKK